MAGKVAPVPCPDCGGQMWDNIEGKRSPKAPDYACKDKQGCGKGVWLKETEKQARLAVAPSNGASPKRPPIVLDKMMKAAITSAIEVSKLFKDGEVTGADHDIVLRIAQSIFIARVDGKGILEVEKAALAKAAEKAAQEAKERAEREAEQRRQAAAVPQSFDTTPENFEQYDDSNLPF